MTTQIQKSEEELLENVEATISKYKMFRRCKNIFIAFSGGKDSLVSATLLSKLGYSVFPIAIDMGDPLFDSKLLEKIAMNSALNVEIIKARDLTYLRNLSEDEQLEVKWRLKFLDSLPKNSTASCTHCYYVKMYMIYNFVKTIGGKAIVLGHQKNDMINSFMKCYWINLYYETITKVKGIPYKENLMLNIMKMNKKIDIKHLKALVERKIAGTDEPFVEKNKFTCDIKIYRPLGSIPERDIIEYVNRLGLKIAGHFCSFMQNWTEKKNGFRQMVHNDIIQRINDNPELEEKIYELILMGLTKEGTLRFRPRNNREKDYPGFGRSVKKF